MRKVLFCACVSVLVSGAWGQSAGDATSTARKVAEETSKVLGDVKSNATSEAQRIIREQAGTIPRAEKVAGEIKQNGAPPSEKPSLEAVERKLAPAMGNVAPEGRKLIAQSGAAPATRSPVAATAPEGSKAQGASAKGKGDAKDPKAAGGDKSGRIDITSQGALYWDAAQSLGVFTDDVVVNHPQFHMTCDELQVYMLKDSDKKKAEPAKADPAKPDAVKPEAGDAEADQEAKIKEAIARGRKVVIEKLDENGEIQVGVCRHATYIGESGDIILRENPQVQRGQNVIIAADPATYMVLKQNGELKVHGPARTQIIQKQEKGAKAQAPGLAPAGAVPSGAPTLNNKKAGQQ